MRENPKNTPSVGLHPERQTLNSVLGQELFSTWYPNSAGTPLNRDQESSEQITTAVVLSTVALIPGPQ